MKKIHFAIYINDNQFFILNQKTKEIKKQKFQSLKESQIIDSNLFFEEIATFFKKSRIHAPIFGWNLAWIKDELMNPIIIEKYKEIFSNYFKYIECKDVTKVLNMKKEIGYLNINTNYVDYYYTKGENKLLRLHINAFNDNISKCISHILTTIYKPKKLIVFGNETNIPEIAETISRNYKMNVTFSEFYEEYVLKEYKM